MATREPAGVLAHKDLAEEDPAAAARLATALAPPTAAMLRFWAEVTMIALEEPGPAEGQSTAKNSELKSWVEVTLIALGEPGPVEGQATVEMSPTTDPQPSPGQAGAVAPDESQYANTVAELAQLQEKQHLPALPTAPEDLANERDHVSAGALTSGGEDAGAFAQLSPPSTPPREPLGVPGADHVSVRGRAARPAMSRPTEPSRMHVLRTAAHTAKVEAARAAAEADDAADIAITAATKRDGTKRKASEAAGSHALYI